MDRKKIKKNIKDLPINISIAGLALLIGLSERSMAAFSEILGTSGHSLGKSYSRMNELKNFWDYYDELKNLKQNSARTILWRLQQKGLVKKKEGKYQITSAGLKIINIFKEKETMSQKLWDGKWRMVMFDIPEKKRKERIWLRYQLLAIDYQPIQKSVFIGKQPIEENIYVNIIEKNLYHCIRIITIGEIDDDEIFKNFENV